MRLNKVPGLSRWFSDGKSIDGKGWNISMRHSKAGISVDELMKRKMFVGIGAMKAGTSWLSDYLKDHPDVFHSPVKELNHFNKVLDNPLNQDDSHFRLRRLESILLDHPPERLFDPTPAQYKRLVDIAAMGRIGTDRNAYFEYFASRIKNESVFGEISPSYSHLGVDGFRIMSESHPDLRVIFLLRDPVERTCSHIRHIWRHRPELELDDIIAGLTPDSAFYFRSDYGPTIDALKSVFSEDRIFLEYYEKLFTEETIARVCKFLGISYHTPDFGHQTNIARTRNILDEDKKRIREKLDPIYKDMVKRTGNQLPERWKV